MAALTEDRNTPQRDGRTYSFEVAGSTKIYAGSLVALNSSGYATPGATSTTLVAVGMAIEQVDNSSGSDGDENVTVQAGIFRFGNSTGGDEITIAEIGDACYIVDDQTVAKTDGTSTRSVAGIVVDVDSTGVWVLIEPRSVGFS